MALELVGGAFLSASFQVVIERMASLEIVDSIWGKKLNEGLFRELKIMLLSANAVVNDAEEKQIWNTNVKEWLHELQAAVYDAEDLVQVINAEALICKIEGQYVSSSSSHHQVLNFFSMTATSFNEQVESKMREILDTLKFILDQKVHLGLKEGVQTISPKGLPTTSTVEESGVYGRDDDKEAIIKLLLTTDESCGEKFSVIPIVGMGGIGKTTLTQLVYNDERVKSCFGFKAWVSVSNEFDIFKITKIITERVTSQTFNNSYDLDLLQLRLQEALEGNKFLLILDDVWNEDYFQWEELKKPFESGACGSKIIVTTRNESVASVMRNNIPSYQIQTMSDENCWKLFVKHAFKNVDPCCHPKLEEIGRQIVKKCKGLPLAVKSLGSILRYRLNLEEWETVLKSDMWDLPKKKNNILSALWLSYHYLPSYLKRCFAYCSVFPKNCEINKDDLIKLWMAEDLLEPQNSKRMEKVGEEYIDDLLSRSLFQKSRESSGISYTMHDLVHDLAIFVAGDFRLSLNDNNWGKLLGKVRYLSHFEEQIHGLEKYQDLLKAKCLRTFFFPSTCYGEIQMQLKNLEAMKLWSTLTRLRSLSFCGCSIVKLSPSIGSLKLLRYLNLSETMITEVPNTVCSLYNLQTLILSYCFKLKLLPTEIGRLIKLRHLDIASTDLEKMPLEMCNLKDLQMLTYFVAGKYSGYTIRLLKDLHHLHGKLSVRGLENIVKVEDVLEANLKEKKYLTEIEYCWSSNDYGTLVYKEVLSGLEPHTSLKNLIIKRYGGENFPKWVGHPSFCNLENIRLQGCRECMMLPPFGQLPFLKKLIISGFDELVKVSNEFYCGGCSVPIRPFRCLESLYISDMKKCEEWSFFEEDGDAAFPELVVFNLENCPRLKARICFPITIEEVRIDGCRKFEFSRKQQQQQFCHLRKFGGLNIQRCEFIDCIALDYITMFTSFSLEDCGNLNSLTYLQQPPGILSLKSLYLRDCAKLESFPRGGLHAPSLEELEISDCHKLKSLPENMQTLLPSLHILHIERCPEVESFPDCPMPSNLQKLQIYECDKLLASRRHWDLRTLTSLSIENIDKLVLDSFPEEGLLPATLINLSIFSLPHLKALNGKALRHLTSLEQLEISFCDELKCLPEEVLPFSLSVLDIYECPLLKQRCQRETGEDWPKIAHIPSIKIDLQDI